MLEILKHELETVMALAGWFKHIILDYCNLILLAFIKLYIYWNCVDDNEFFNLLQIPNRYYLCQ